MTAQGGEHGVGEIGLPQLQRTDVHADSGRVPGPRRRGPARLVEDPGAAARRSAPSPRRSARRCGGTRAARASGGASARSASAQPAISSARRGGPPAGSRRLELAALASRRAGRWASSTAVRDAVAASRVVVDTTTAIAPRRASPRTWRRRSAWRRRPSCPGPGRRRRAMPTLPRDGQLASRRRSNGRADTASHVLAGHRLRQVGDARGSRPARRTRRRRSAPASDAVAVGWLREALGGHPQQQLVAGRRGRTCR